MRRLALLLLLPVVSSMNYSVDDSTQALKETKELYWKDSKKADWQDSVVTYPVRRVVTDKQACGQDDCGADK